MLVTESDVESRLVKRVESLGGKCIKLWPTQEGLPDRLVVLPRGTIIFVELKRPKGGRLAPLQVWQHKVLRGLGCRVYVVNTYEKIEEVLKAEEPNYKEQ